MTTLLIIDDDPSIRTMFSRALRSLGDVEQAPGGAEGLRMLALRKYDVLLLDLHMPGVDGFAVLEALRSKVGPNRETPTYVVTADSTDAARVELLRRRAVFLLSKPVNLSSLVGLVGATLKRAADKNAPPSSPRKPGG